MASPVGRVSSIPIDGHCALRFVVGIWTTEKLTTTATMKKMSTTSPSSLPYIAPTRAIIAKPHNPLTNTSLLSNRVRLARTPLLI